MSIKSFEKISHIFLNKHATKYKKGKIAWQNVYSGKMKFLPIFSKMQSTISIENILIDLIKIILLESRKYL